MSAADGSGRLALSCVECGEFFWQEKPGEIFCSKRCKRNWDARYRYRLNKQRLKERRVKRERGRL